MSIWKPILAALVIFAAGVITGGLAIRLAVSKPQRPPANNALGPANFRPRGDLLERMDRELYLTPGQRTNIARILRESQERTTQLWQTIAPQAHAEHRRTRELIREELVPEQRDKFDKLLKARPLNQIGEGKVREELRRNLRQNRDADPRPPKSQD